MGSPFLMVLGIGCLVVFGLVIVLFVGLPIAALGSFVAGLLGHPPGRSLDRRKRSHVRPPIPLALRTAVLERDHWQCVYCGSSDDLQMDHIIPISRGGATTLENLETLCQPCNEEKGAH